MPLVVTSLDTLALVLACLPVVLLLACGPALLHPRARRGPNAVAVGVGVILAVALLLVWRVAVTGHGSAVGAIAEVALLLAAQVGVVLAGLLIGWGRITRSTKRNPPVVAAALVVLGAGLTGTRVTRILAERLLAALALHASLRVGEGGGTQPGEAQPVEAQPVPPSGGAQPVPVVVSGGQGSDEVTSEAAAMATFLVDHGLDPASILLEDRSTSTRENLVHSADLVAERSPAGVAGRLVVVTNGFHIHRTAALGRALGLDLVVVGCRTPPYYLPRALVRELVAVLALHPRRQVAVAVVLTIVGTGVGLPTR